MMVFADAKVKAESIVGTYERQQAADTQNVMGHVNRLDLTQNIAIAIIEAFDKGRKAVMAEMEAA